MGLLTGVLVTTIGGLVAWNRGWIPSKASANGTRRDPCGPNPNNDSLIVYCGNNPDCPACKDLINGPRDCPPIPDDGNLERYCSKYPNCHKCGELGYTTQGQNPVLKMKTMAKGTYQ